MILARVISVDLDENNNIKVDTEYRFNGERVQVGTTRYSLGILSNTAEIKKLLNRDIQEHSMALIARTFAKNQNQINVGQLKSDILNLQLITNKVTVQTADRMTFDTDGENMLTSPVPMPPVQAPVL